MTRIVLAVAMLAAMGSVSLARTVQEEPAMGLMREGERLLVDDGSCGPGKIREVIGGNHVKVGGVKRVERIRQCIDKR
jgi:hypothetical protein